MTHLICWQIDSKYSWPQTSSNQKSSLGKDLFKYLSHQQIYLRSPQIWNFAGPNLLVAWNTLTAFVSSYWPRDTQKLYIYPFCAEKLTKLDLKVWQMDAAGGRGQARFIELLVAWQKVFCCCCNFYTTINWCFPG